MPSPDDDEPVSCPACWGRGRLSDDDVLVVEDVVTYYVDVCDICDGTGRVAAWAARALLSSMPAQG